MAVDAEEDAGFLEVEADFEAEAEEWADFEAEGEAEVLLLTVEALEALAALEEWDFEEDVMKDLEWFFGNNNGYENVEWEYWFTSTEAE